MTAYGGFKPITDIRTKFYQRENQFNNFRDIDDEKMARILKIKDAILETYKNSKKGKSSFKMTSDNLDIYLAFLNYVTNPQIHNTLRTFDERVLLLILGSDPELKTFYKYLEAPIIESDTVRAGKRVKQKYIDEDTYSSEVRAEIGFYDPKLHTYEEAYFKKYLSKNQLVKSSKRSRMNQLIERAEKIKGFDNITDERFEELKAMAEQWHLEFEDADYETISYHVGVQYDYFRLKTIAEQELMLILLLDPDMKALKMYEEESQIKTLALRCKAEFGIYSQSIINLEKKYKERFYPELKLSEWSK